MKKLCVGLVVAVLFVLLIWASDRITLQGERTIFTVACVDGQWAGQHCTGHLVPGPRYAFRASTLRHEVIYWVRGTNGPSGIFADCAVVDRDNWTCHEGLGQKTSITYEMVKGRPTHNAAAQTTAFHDVPKWKWWWLKLGLPAGADADN